MRKLRIALTAVATASMVLGTMGAAMAQSTGQWETRADFIFQLDKSLGIQPVYPATPDFQDVPASDPYYGYIEAAYQAGITNGITQGVFGPSLALTRAEAAKYLVIAFGAGAAAQNITSTSFGDNANIPSALVGYVGEAAALGLLKGFPDGDFHPNSNLTMTQEGYLLSQLTTAMSSLTLKVTASSSDVAPGQLVTLSTSGTTASGTSVASPIVTYSVTGTNAASALVSGNTFVGSAPGNYTVQAASGTATGTTQVSVYGPAAGLKINAPTSVVANGASTSTVTVDVVDANGNIVADSTDSIDLYTDTNAAAGILDGGSVASAGYEVNTDAVNGVATFTIQSGTVAGATTNLGTEDETVENATGNENNATAAVASAAQVPTSVSVTANSPYIDANGPSGGPGGTDVLSAIVLDQTGNPMLSGAYTVSFSASGPANFGGSATAAGVYYGPSGSAGAATATLDDVQGSTGAITVTASGTGLTSGTASVTSVIAGAPSQIAISGAQTITADQGGSTGANYTVTLEDSHGYPAVWEGASPASITVTSSDAAIAPYTIQIANGADSGGFNIEETVAGSYTLTAAATGLTSGTSTLTVTPGAAAYVAVSPLTTDPTYAANPSSGTLFLSAATPTFTASAQLQDQYGNTVPQAGVEIDFYLNGGGGNTGTGTLTANGQSVTSASGNDSVAYTNSSGVATATVTAQSYVGDSYQVDVESPSVNNYADYYSSKVKLAQNVPMTNSVTAYDLSNNQVSSLVSGGTYYALDSQTDSHGNTVNPVTFTSTNGGPDNLLVTLSGSGSITLSSSGGTGVTAEGSNQYLINLPQMLMNREALLVTPTTAGPISVSTQSVDVLNSSGQTSAYAVTPGSQVENIGFSVGGTAINPTDATTFPSVPAGGSVEVTMTSEDAGGNPIIAANNIPVDVGVLSSPGGATYELRPTASGTDYPAIGSGPYPGDTAITIPAGQSSVTFYLVNDSASAASFGFSPDTFGYVVTGPGSTVSTPVASGTYAGDYAVTFNVQDQNGNNVQGVAVSFAVTTGAGSVVNMTGTTDANGNVTAYFVSPGGTNTAVVTCTVAGTAMSATGSVSY